MRIAVVGTGYVGLISGVCLAELGHTLTCVDKDHLKISRLRAGDIPIYEPGLAELVERNVGCDRLTFDTDLSEALVDAEAVFIAVGTPTRRGDGQADLSFVFAVADEIARSTDRHITIVTKSTVPVGTNRAVANIVRSVNPELDFDVVSNPEFLREGAAINDFMEPDRVVVGVDCARSAATMEEIYHPLSSRGYPVIVTDIESAEMIKYAANAFLAMKVTFINDIAGLCEKVGADVAKVARGMGLDNRIGDRFLNVGPGYGGSCFPKDTLALARTGQTHGHRLGLVEATIEINNAIKLRMVEKIVSVCGGSIAGQRIVALGATFKAETDDMRDAPSLTILPELIRRGASINVVDPQGRAEGEALLSGVTWADDPHEAAEDADAIIILTEWQVFQQMDLRRIAAAMRTPILVDLRNLLTEEDALGAGFLKYECLGRGTSNQATSSNVVAL